MRRAIVMRTEVRDACESRTVPWALLSIRVWALRSMEPGSGRSFRDFGGVRGSGGRRILGGWFCRGGERGGASIGLTEGENHVFIILFHVAIIGAVGGSDEAEGVVDLGAGLFEGPAAVASSVGDLRHGGSIEAMVAVEVNGLIGGVVDCGGGFIEQVVHREAVGEGAIVDDWNMHPFHSHFVGEFLFADCQRVIGGVGECDDCFDVMRANDASHRPIALPGAAVDFAGDDLVQLHGENVRSAVSPELLAGENDERQGQDPPRPDAISARIGLIDGLQP